jgi:hypothetical protein
VPPAPASPPVKPAGFDGNGDGVGCEDERHAALGQMRAPAATPNGSSALWSGVYFLRERQVVAIGILESQLHGSPRPPLDAPLRPSRFADAFEHVLD